MSEQLSIRDHELARNAKIAVKMVLNVPHLPPHLIENEIFTPLGETIAAFEGDKNDREDGEAPSGAKTRDSSASLHGDSKTIEIPIAATEKPHISDSMRDGTSTLQTHHHHAAAAVNMPLSRTTDVKNPIINRHNRSGSGATTTTSSKSTASAALFRKPKTGILESIQAWAAECKDYDRRMGAQKTSLKGNNGNGGMSSDSTTIVMENDYRNGNDTHMMPMVMLDTKNQKT